MNSKKEEVVDLNFTYEDDVYSVASDCPLEPRKRCVTKIDLTIVADEVQSR